MNNLELYCTYKVCDKPCQESVKFTVSQDQTFILQDNTLSVYNLDSEKECSSFESDFLRTSTNIKEYFGKYIVFGHQNEVRTINYNTGKTDNYPVSFDAIAWSEAAHFAVIAGDEVATYIIHDIDIDCDLIKVGSSSIYAEDAKHQYINLGWGSESTQFRGKRKKQDEVETVQYHVDKSPSTIIWSHSNDMFLINFFNTKTQRRQYSIFSSECKLLYRGPDIEGLQAVVTWKPPHSLVAVPVAVDGTMELQFYEKIGPIRDKFTLRNSIPIVDMLWSNDGLLIGIVQEDDVKSILSIYMCQLGRWYLKQYYQYEKPQKIEGFHLNQTLYNDKVYQLCISTNTDFVMYFFKVGQTPMPVLSNSVGKTGCAVIDGNLLEVYLYSEQIIPPGMPELVYDAKEPINATKFHALKPEISCLDSSGNIHIYNYDLKKLDACVKDVKGNHYFFRTDDVIEAYDTHLENDTTVVERIKYTAGNTEVNSEEKLLINMPICQRKYTNNNDYYVTSYKNVVVVENDANKFLGLAYESIPIDIECIKIDDAFYIFALLESKKFYINNFLISHNVSSFAIHDDYLHYTNSLRNKMYTIILNKVAIEKILNGTINAKNSIGRSIETNALLVTGIPKKPDILLYMPRGNLENIRVELIMLRKIESIINTPNSWNDAHDLIRMQKMDSNILVDLNYERFMASVTDFITCISSPSILCQFIEELSEKSTSCDVFFQFYPEKFKPNIPNKVLVICEKIIDTIKHSRIYCEYLLTVVCACVVAYPDIGLQKAFDNMVVVLTAHKNPKAVKFVVNCINYLKNKHTDKELFTAALQTTNLQFTNIVADALKKDPKEYKPILAKFSNFQSIELRFELASYLQKYSSALAWLFRMQNQEKLFDFIEQNNLESKALEDVPHNMQELRKILHEKHVELLFAKGMFSPGFVYSLGVGDASVAYQCAKKLVLVPESVDLLDRVDADKQVELASILSKLENNLNWHELIFYYRFKLCDYRKVVELYMASGQVKKAHEVWQEYSVKEFEATYFDDEVSVDVKQQLDILTNLEESFKKNKERLEVVRADKLVSELMDEDEMETLYAESSIASTKGSSKHSKQSARQRRRLEKKLTTLRPGGKYEEIALVRALHTTITDAFKMTHKALQLFELAEISFDQTRELIQNFIQRLYNLQSQACNCADFIWNEKDIRIKGGHYNLMSDMHRKRPPHMDITWTRNVL